jgi:hypothetical protein
MRQAYFLSAVLFTAVLCVSGIGLATAEPQKNQIVVEAMCDNGQSYTFVINGMSKTGHVVPNNTGVDVPKVRNVNVVVKQFTVEYFDEDGNRVGGDEYGNNKVLNGDLIQCSGITPEPIVLQGLGAVTAEYEFQAFITPRGKA